jgi:pyridoxal phosphate enzyme (YggS family)
MNLAENLAHVKSALDTDKVTLVAVSKTQPVEKIQSLYDAGQRDFGENRVQELTAKQHVLPGDIRWHLIGHLQTNKVKYIAPFVHLIHSVDSLKLLKEIDKEAAKSNRVIDCLLQVYIAKEETKFGLSEEETVQILGSMEFKAMQNTRIRGLMGMATNTENENTVRNEFRTLTTFFDEVKSAHFTVATDFDTISMGMSSDYKIAIEEGSTMIRVGSALFGERK